MPLSSATGPFTITILLGALLATPYALFAASSRRPAVPFGVGLAVASLLYLLFALFGPAGPSDLLLETLGLLLFGSVAFAGVRWFPPLLAAGWTAHVAWDLLLHPGSTQRGYAPWWYPVLCIGFDLLVAGCILAIHRDRLTGRSVPALAWRRRDRMTFSEQRTAVENSNDAERTPE